MLRFTCQSLIALTMTISASALVNTVTLADGHASGTLTDCPTCQQGTASGACPDCGRGGGGRGSGGGGGGLRSRANSRYDVQCRTLDTHNPDLFYNYYVPPTCGGIGAQLYMTPGPVPGHVGHTYFTYQPLYPHEYLYQHHRTYHRYYNCGKGLNRTKVHWTTPPGSGIASVVLNCLRLPR